MHSPPRSITKRKAERRLPERSRSRPFENAETRREYDDDDDEYTLQYTYFATSAFAQVSVCTYTSTRVAIARDDNIYGLSRDLISFQRRRWNRRAQFPREHFSVATYENLTSSASLSLSLAHRNQPTRREFVRSPSETLTHAGSEFEVTIDLRESPSSTSTFITGD